MSQIDTYKCDECGETVMEPVNWVRLELVGLDATPLGGKQLRADVCSQRCAHKYLIHTAVAIAPKGRTDGT